MKWFESVVVENERRCSWWWSRKSKHKDAENVNILNPYSSRRNVKSKRTESSGRGMTAYTPNMTEIFCFFLPRFSVYICGIYLGSFPLFSDLDADLDVFIYILFIGSFDIHLFLFLLTLLWKEAPSPLPRSNLLRRPHHAAKKLERSDFKIHFFCELTISSMATL